jgi:hypothetical protein
VGLCVAAALAAGWWHGRAQFNAGYEAHQTEMARAAAEAEKERRDDDARLQGLSDDGLCREYFGTPCLHYDSSDQLRRVPNE